MLTRHAPRAAAPFAALIVVWGGISPARGGDFLFHNWCGPSHFGAQPALLTSATQGTTTAVTPNVMTSAFVMPQATAFVTSQPQATAFVTSQPTATAFFNSGTTPTTTVTSMTLVPVGVKHHHIQWAAVPQATAVSAVTTTGLIPTNPTTGSATATGTATHAVTAPSLTGSPAVTQVKTVNQTFIGPNGQPFTAQSFVVHPDGLRFPNLSRIFGGNSQGLESFEGRLLSLIAVKSGDLSAGGTARDAALKAIFDVGMSALKTIPGVSILTDPNVEGDVQQLIQSLVQTNGPSAAPAPIPTTPPPPAPIPSTPGTPTPVTTSPPPVPAASSPGLTIPARIDIYFHIDTTPPKT